MHPFKTLFIIPKTNAYLLGKIEPLIPSDLNWFRKVDLKSEHASLAAQTKFIEAARNSGHLTKPAYNHLYDSLMRHEI